MELSTAVVLGKLSVSGCHTNLDDGMARACCDCSRCGWGCLDIVFLSSVISLLSPSLLETARYRRKYCLKGPLSSKQPTMELSTHIKVVTILNMKRR